MDAEGIEVMKDMRAAVKESAGRGIALHTMAAPEPGADDVVIKVNVAGICGTDLHIYQWDEWSRRRIKPPVIMGHEFVGVICKTGSNVRQLKIGQRVTAEGHITCGSCRYCRSGQGHICQNVKIIGVDRDGCFADFICMPQGNVWPVSDRIPDRHAALFDPIGNAMHTVMAQSISMKNVLITGAGAIGLFAIPIAKENGASRVIVIEPCDFKREIALEVGADFVLDPTDADIKEKILDSTNGQGPDVLLEMSGNINAIRLGLDILSNGGTVSLLGIPHGEIPLDLANEVIFKGITIHGITGRKMYETWYQTDSFLQKNGKSIEPVITHCLNLSDIEHGLQLMEQSKAVKVLLNIQE